MISYTREQQNTIPTSSVKIIGLGGAGANMLERVALDGLDGAELLALNTDIRTLSGCVANEKIQLGRNLTKGLGAGGDPELGQQAMLETEAEVRAAVKGRRIVFICAGLGGGTGSGAAPILTRIAREEGAFVVVFATMPFAFEGLRRRDQAETALNELAVLSNALVTFDNNRMGELVLAKQGIHEAFSAADKMICESIKAVIRLVVRPGLINVGLDDLMSALRTNRSRCLFGSGLANGKDRAARALRNALASPLLDQGALLKEARTVLVHLSGGEDLTLYEVELLMKSLQKFVPEKAHVLFGAAIDPTMGDNLSITLISALPEDSLAVASRDSLSRSAAEDPVLDPSDGFASPAAKRTPVEPPPLPKPAPEPEPEKPAPAKVAAAAATISLFDDRPFAEPVPAPQAKPAPEPEPQPIVESVSEIETIPEPEPEPEADEVVEEEEVTAVVEETIEREIEEPVIEDDTPFGFAEELDELVEEEPEWLDDEPESVPTPESEPVPQLEAVPPVPLKLRGKTPAGQTELSFDAGPRGRFEGESPNLVDGDDLDIPPFLRKKR
jgi:cell division protein FtsZ